MHRVVAYLAPCLRGVGQNVDKPDGKRAFSLVDYLRPQQRIVNRSILRLGRCVGIQVNRAYALVKQVVLRLILGKLRSVKLIVVILDARPCGRLTGA